MEEEQTTVALSDDEFINRLTVQLFLDALEKDAKGGGAYYDREPELYRVFEEMTGIKGNTGAKRLFWAFNLGAGVGLDLRGKLDAHASGVAQDA